MAPWKHLPFWHVTLAMEGFTGGMRFGRCAVTEPPAGIAPLGAFVALLNEGRNVPVLEARIGHSPTEV